MDIESVSSGDNWGKKYLKGLGKLKERSSHCTNFVTLKLNTVYSSIVYYR